MRTLWLTPEAARLSRAPPQPAADALRRRSPGRPALSVGSRCSAIRACNCRRWRRLEPPSAARDAARRHPDEAVTGRHDRARAPFPFTWCPVETTSGASAATARVSRFATARTRAALLTDQVHRHRNRHGVLLRLQADRPPAVLRRHAHDGVPRAPAARPGKPKIAACVRRVWWSVLSGGVDSAVAAWLLKQPGPRGRRHLHEELGR